MCVYLTYQKSTYVNFTTSICYRCIAKCKVMYTDTDSLIYHVECNDIYETMISLSSTSDYPADNVYGMPLATKKYQV